jgi:hypothetical protein
MFRTLARLLDDPTLTNPAAAYRPQEVFAIHPYQLSQWLEAVWNWKWAFAGWLSLSSQPPPAPYLGDPLIIGALGFPTTPDDPLDQTFLRSGIGQTAAQVPGFYPPPAPGQVQFSRNFGLPWEHTAYALIIETTGVYEILAEVTRRYMVGETLEPPSRQTEQWLRSTEELFFRDPPLFHITGINSQFRPDARVNRRNLYWRMLGMDLPHPLPPRYQPSANEQPWKTDVGVANVRFHELWVELLRQVWVAYENVKNTSGPNPTDPAYIAETCRYLKDMLIMRRLNGQLAREEFVAVSQLSWFHLTVESDASPLIADLRAQGTNPFERLVKIGQRVGMQPSPRSWELFQIADLVSSILRFIELGLFDNPVNVSLLYNPGTAIQTDMARIIDLWEMATNDQIKDQGVRLPGGASKPVQHAAPARSLSAGANGHRPVTGTLTR